MSLSTTYVQSALPLFWSAVRTLILAETCCVAKSFRSLGHQWNINQTLRQRKRTFTPARPKTDRCITRDGQFESEHTLGTAHGSQSLGCGCRQWGQTS